MKRILLIAIKIGLFVFFIYNLNIKIDLKSGNNDLVIKEDFQKDLDWLNEKYRCAQKLGAQYSPELYFKDIAEIRLKEKAKGFDYRAQAFINSTQTNLFSVFHNNVMENRKKLDGKEYDSFIARITSSQNMYEDLVDPGSRERHEKNILKMRQASYWLNNALSLIAWLLKQYIKNFILALILLWLWWYEEKESLRITNPLSFLLCLFIYPVVIIRTLSRLIRSNGRYLLMSVEYRRHQKDLFALFSENEIAELKRVAQSKINLAEYRKQLKLQNLTIRHSLIPALVVTIIFVALPQSKIMASNSNSVKENLCFKVCKEAPPDIGNYHYSNTIHTDISACICNDIDIPIFTETLIGKIRVFNERCLKGYKRRLDTIPVLVNNYFNLFLKSIINKIQKNEKKYYFNRSVVCGFQFFCSG